jgi:drug/metabolite transporter (DMT)-like permease
MLKENNDNNLKILEVNEEMEKMKRTREKKAYFLFVFTQLIWTIQGLQLKSFFSLYSSIYDLNSLVFWRHFGVALTAYLSIRYKKINFKYPSQIHYKTWFYIRNVGIYICIYTWMKSLSIFRLSTCQILSGVNPLMTIIFSIIFLKERFYTIYAIGIIICFTGSVMIILNERKLEKNIDKNNSKENIFIGILSLIINVNLFALGNVGQKFLCNEHLSPEEQTFYFGFYSIFISCFFCLINLKFGLSNISYCLYAFLNGIIFYLCNYLTSVSFQNIEISKLQPVTFLSSILIVLSGTIIFSEKLFFTDILGATMIIGFIIYNGMNRPKS